jgi:tRNA(Ile)-lysidine synthase
VSFTPATLLEALSRMESRAGPAGRFVIALSGGLDSTVLADALLRTAEEHQTPLLAVHVDHGLQQDSPTFAAFCRRFADERSLLFESVRVEVDQQSGSGLEAAAREARYAALARFVQDGDWLLSAHHQDDQAETLLLNLLRGSGPLGVAAMPALRRFGRGWLARPLLEVTRGELEDYAKQQAVDCCEDPSNDDLRFDRNFLRREVLPSLAKRFGDATGRLARSAALARDAAELLDQLADLDLLPLLDASGRLAIAGLKELSPARQRNALRRLARRKGIAVPGAVHLEQILEALLEAREDAEPAVSWPGGEARRFRDRLYLMQPLPRSELAEHYWVRAEPLLLGPGLGRLEFENKGGEGLDVELANRGLTVRARRGGEEIKLESHGPTRKLKKLLNERAIVPWMRGRLPLIYSGDRLVAVADLWIAADAVARPGLEIRWRDRPSLD